MSNIISKGLFNKFKNRLKLEKRISYEEFWDVFGDKFNLSSSIKIKYGRENSMVGIKYYKGEDVISITEYSIELNYYNMSAVDKFLPTIIRNMVEVAVKEKLYKKKRS